MEKVVSRHRNNASNAPAEPFAGASVLSINPHLCSPAFRPGTAAIWAGADWRPIVAIPARNEAERLPALIESLSRQSWLEISGRRLHVIVVLNNCNDGSAEVAAKAAAGYPNLQVELIEVEFPPGQAHVGAARRLAMERAWSTVSDPSRSLLLTTDADAVPSPAWIDANLAAIMAGADIVGGLIVGDKAEEALLGPKFLRRAARQLSYARLTDRLAALIDPIAHDPWPRHCDHTGASLAVRADAYAAVGGIPELPSNEDREFVRRICAAGYHLRHSLDVRVRVSARLDGRAQGGMADCLKQWVRAEELGLPHVVESPRAIVRRLVMVSRSRHGLAQQQASGSAVPLLAQPAEQWTNIPPLMEMITSIAPDPQGGIPVEIAIKQLEQLIAATEHGLVVS